MVEKVGSDPAVDAFVDGIGPTSHECPRLFTRIRTSTLRARSITYPSESEANGSPLTERTDRGGPAPYLTDRKGRSLTPPTEVFPEMQLFSPQGCFPPRRRLCR